LVASRLGNQAASVPVTVGAPSAGLRRVGEVPIYFADPLVRRAAALQRTRDAQPPQAGLHPDTARQLGIGEGDPVRLRQGGAEAVLPARIDATMAAGCVRVAAGHPATAALGELHGPITVERG
jgi:NADH-quinone oxidoreductase subunit G